MAGRLAKKKGPIPLERCYDPFVLVWNDRRDSRILPLIVRREITIPGQCSEDYFNLEVMGDPLGAAKGVVLFSAVSTSVLASSTVELV